MMGPTELPPPSKVEGLQAITRLKPIKKSQYCVYTYALNKDIVNSDGKVDDFRGMFFILGCFGSKTKAEEHVKELMLTTKHEQFYISEYGKPIRIETETNTDNISRIHIDTDNKIKELESEQYKKDREIYEKRIKLCNDVSKEAEEECNPDHIEHFKRQCYLAIKNRSIYEGYKNEYDTSFANYEKRKDLVRDHYKRHPEHEQQWLPYLKEKLTERGELMLYNTIESGYEKYRSDLLGL